MRVENFQISNFEVLLHLGKEIVTSELFFVTCDL